MKHIPVLKKEVLKYLIPEKGEISRLDKLMARDDSGSDFVFVDCTLGAAGHAKVILKKLITNYSLPITFLGIDADEKALKIAKENLKNIIFEKPGVQKNVMPAKAGIQDRINFTFIRDNFKNYSGILQKTRILSKKSVDAVLIDLGISSMQIDSLDRGFSFKNPKALLDMRMDTSFAKASEGKFNFPMTAADILNKYSESELINVFKNSGERFYKKIVGNIIEFRKGNSSRLAKSSLEQYNQSNYSSSEAKRNREVEILKQVQDDKKHRSINTVGDLILILDKSIPERFKHGKTHFATNIFRALRMEVNSELENIKIAIPEIIKSLKIGGRLAVITFHSTEDKLVKDIFNGYINPCQCPKNMPCICGKLPELKKVAKFKPGNQEILINPRSRSAILRIVEKV